MNTETITLHTMIVSIDGTEVRYARVRGLGQSLPLSRLSKEELEGAVEANNSDQGHQFLSSNAPRLRQGHGRSA